jgi:cell division protease FtsH
MKNHQTAGVLLVTFFMLLALLGGSFVMNAPTVPVETLSYTAFIQKVQNGELTSITQKGAELEIIGKPSLKAIVKGKTTTPNKGKETKPATEKPTAVVAAVPTAPASATKVDAEKQQQEERRQSAQKMVNSLLGIPVPDAVAVAAPHYKVQLPVGSTAHWLPIVEQAKVDFVVDPPEREGLWWGIVSSLLLPIFLGIMIFVLYRNMASGGGQAMSFGKSKAKLQMDSNIKITFKDVAGINEAKAELEEVVDFLKNADRYLKLGAKIPKGVLLVGSPGTGKTLLAKAVAGEAGVPFFSISGSDFVEMFVGVGASRVRDLFDQAKKQSPCIVFIDEIDAVGRQRGSGMGGGNDEREQTLNQMLVEMDGFDATTGIIIIAATNRPDILDKALLRPGRFDRQVMIDKPDLQGREQILEVHATGKPLAEDVDLKRLAKRTSGFSGADLSNLLNEAALLAARQEKETINMLDVENSIDRVVVGLEKKSKIISEKDKEITAYHEIGHALTCVLTPDMDPLRKVTIVPRGMALGYAWYSPDEDAESTHMTKRRMLGEIGVALGGRVAEALIFGEDFITTGASNDLQKVSRTARSIITTYGMNERLGSVCYGESNEHLFMGRDFGTQRNYSEQFASAIDEEVKRLVDEQYKYVWQLLSDNRDMLEALTKALLEKETLDDVEVADIMNRVREDRAVAVAVNN